MQIRRAEAGLTAAKGIVRNKICILQLSLIQKQVRGSVRMRKCPILSRNLGCAAPEKRGIRREDV